MSRLLGIAYVRWSRLARPRREPKIGDRRVTKKHGFQIRVVETHGGRWVRSGSRYRYEWRSPAELVGTQFSYLIPWPVAWPKTEGSTP